MAVTSDLRALNFTVSNRNVASSSSVPSGAISTSSSSLKAKMVLNRSDGNTYPEEFYFPYPPIDIQYTNLSAEWTEIARPGRTPLVEYVTNKLLSVSFKFLVAKPFDGLSYSVDTDLSKLRRMASSKRTVSFFGFDGMFTNPFQIPEQETRSRAGFYFHITDFSISSLRRNSDNEITAAECSITVTEVNNPNITVVQFPVITYPVAVAPPTKKKTPPPSSGLQLLTAEQLFIAQTTAGSDYAGLGIG